MSCSLPGLASSYRRGITYIKDGKQIDKDVLVPICLCRKCGKSSLRGGNASGDYCHAILPDSLIPFTYYTLLFVLTVLDVHWMLSDELISLQTTG